MSRIRTIITPANLMAAFAIFFALGGSALAVKQAAKNSVTTASIRDATVTGKDVRDDSLSGADVDESTLALPQTSRPTGPSGGDLTGNYPNPVIKPGVVNEDKLAEGAVTTSRLGNDAVTTAKIAGSGVTNSDIAAGAVSAGSIQSDAVRKSHVATGSIGASELDGFTTVVSTGVAVSAGAPADASVSCTGGRKLIAGGYAWLQDEPNSIIASAPSEGNPDTTWDVRGMVDAGSNTLFAWASCLKV